MNATEGVPVPWWMHASQWTPLILPAVSGALGLLVAVRCWRSERRIYAWLTHSEPRFPERRPPLEALESVLIWAGIIMVLLSAFELSVPMVVPTTQHAWRLLVVFLSSAVGGIGLGVGYRDRRHPYLAEWAIAVFSCGAMALAGMAALPMQSRPGWSYPIMLNAYMVGAAGITAYWCWLAKVWSQQVNGANAWSVAGEASRLIPGFTAWTASLSIVLAIVLAAWPALRGIIDRDDTPGRIIGGMAGYLLLLVALLYRNRVQGRMPASFHTIIAALSMLGFLIVRSLTYSGMKVIAE